MCNWKIEIILNSGKEITAYYRGEEYTSDAVTRKVFVGNSNNLTGLNNEDGTKNIFVRLGNIEYVAISAC